MLEIYKIFSNPVSIAVIVWLLIYLFFVFVIFFYKYFKLYFWIKNEEESLNHFLLKDSLSSYSSLTKCVEKTENINSYTFDACIYAARKKANSGIIFLSIVASTAPFIGLFGTVVGILEAFNGIKEVMTINMIAPSIADALIATAIGILVAIPAYSFHQILSKKVEDLITTLYMLKDFYLSK